MRHRGRMKAGTLAAVTILAAVFAVSAFAGGNLSSKTVYASAATKVQAAVATKHAATPSAPASTPATTAAGTLPFTGVDLGIIVAAGVVLVLLGWGLRHVTRKHPAA